MRIPPVNRWNQTPQVYGPKLKDRQGQDAEGQGALGYQSSGQPKKGSSESQDQPQDQSEEKGTQSESDEGSSSLSVNAALDEFRNDPKTANSGLNAVVEGQGPGLRVVLKDTQGGLVRQMSGEEFVKLNQSKRPEKDPVRGKILDRKM